MKIERDYHTRVLYATDASAYRELPIGVSYPSNKEEVIKLVKDAEREGFTIIPRAAGTSLAGQVVGSGVVADITSGFNKILEINFEEHWARVEPGVVLDTLNREAAKGGLFFGPETSTSNRCTLGGMVGNNSCGSHSLIYGSTRDHLLEAEVVLSDGSLATFKELTEEQFKKRQLLESREGEIYRFVASLLDNRELLEEIEQEFPDPRVTRRNCGYALDQFIESNYNLCKLLAGSEGTLAFIVELKLNLVPLPPKEKMLIAAHCSTLNDAFEANLIALKHSPAAVELMDSNILELSKENISQSKNRFFIEGDPAAIIVVELVDESRERLLERVEECSRELLESRLVYHTNLVSAEMAPRVWALRKAGLGLLSTMAGDSKPVSVIEDSAVAPERLPSYMADFQKMLKKLSLECVYHAHIGSGELHLRPILNLKKSEDVALFREVAVETAHLVKRHKGSLSGEHGDGRLRGEFIPIMYGPRIYQVMKELKGAFDPKGLFNRGKIVNTPPMDSSLRYRADFEPPHYKSYFDYSAQGGWLRAIEQCNGSGDCLKSELFSGVMCPSYQATREERNSTRGRANLLREFLTNPREKSPFKERELKEALELCISCKGCKSECPSNVDMARYRAEFMQHYHSANAPSLRTVAISRMVQVERLGSLFPPLYNYFATAKWSSTLLKRVLKFAIERELPKLSKITLRRWAANRAINRASQNSSLLGEERVIYLFADEFTNYNEAEVGVAFIELMESLNYRVIIPKHRESGRAAISKGMLKRARKLAIENVKLLSTIVTEESPLIGIEPSTILSFRDEYPDLVSQDLKSSAKELAKNALLYDEFIMREVKRGRIESSSFTTEALQIKLHGHCHQKALASAELSAEMLSLPKNYRVELLESGCCGMAGSFGYEQEHYQLSMKIGEQQLFPMVRTAAPSVVISAPGFSCREQIKSGTGRIAHHPIVLLQKAVAITPSATSTTSTTSSSSSTSTDSLSSTISSS